MSFFINPTVSELLYHFHFNIQFITFSLYYFFNSKVFLICLLQFVFNVPTISSPLRSLHRTVFLTFLIRKTSSDQFGVYLFAKMFLYFDLLTISLILNLGFWLLISLLESIHVLDFTWTGFIKIVLWYVLLYLLAISSLKLKSCIYRFYFLRF